MRTVIALILTITLAGCSIFQKPEVVIRYKEKQLFHPDLPMAVDCGDLDTYTVIDGHAVQTYSGNILLRSCISKLLGSLEETQQVLCNYRKELQEPYCTRFNSED